MQNDRVHLLCFKLSVITIHVKVFFDQLVDEICFEIQEDQTSSVFRNMSQDASNLLECF